MKSGRFTFSNTYAAEVSSPPLQVRQEPDLSAALGHQEGSDHWFFHRIYVADHLSVLWSGLLVWLQPGGEHWGVHTRNPTAGITLTIFTKYGSLQH